MRKLKSEFIKDEQKTKIMENFFLNTLGHKNDKGYKFIGVYYYKNYEIFFDHIPENKSISKHISIKEMSNKRIEQKDLELIANHFVEDNYSVQYGLFDNNMANIWEEKGTVN
jgi:hypothetical protein